MQYNLVLCRYYAFSLLIFTVKNMTSKIIETSKDSANQQEDLNKLRTLLMKSDYPNHIIEKHMKESIKSTTSTTNRKLNEDNKDKMKHQNTLPVMNGIEVLKRKLEKLNIKVFFSYPKKIKSACTNLIENKSKSNIYTLKKNV